MTVVQRIFRLSSIDTLPDEAEEAIAEENAQNAPSDGESTASDE